MTSSIPEIPVSDIAEATAYYEEKLGFNVDWDGADDGIAGISNGECRLFWTNDAYREGAGTTGPVFVWLNLQSKGEVDSLYELWLILAPIGRGSNGRADG